MTTTWACQNDRLGIPGANIDAVPDEAVEAELAMLTIGGGPQWKDNSVEWRRGYHITLGWDYKYGSPAGAKRVQLTRGNDWLAVSEVRGKNEEELRRAALDWGVRAMLALAARELERNDSWKDNQYADGEAP